MDQTGLHITSEIGRLREAIVHTPGRELELVTPRNFGRMLMEDLLYLKAARQDHEAFVRVLERAGVRVHQVGNLLRETLLGLTPALRAHFVEQLCDLEGCPAAYRERLHQLNPAGLADVAIEGELTRESLTRYLRQTLYALPPLPNLMFVRDGATIVNQGVILGAMRHSVRAREALLYEWIFRHHPRWQQSASGQGPWFWLEQGPTPTGLPGRFQGRSGLPHLTVEGARLQLWGRQQLSVGGESLSGPHAHLIADDMVLEADELRLSAGRRFIIEGGNLFVLAPDTLLVGCNARTSPAAIDALATEMLLHRSQIRQLFVAISNPRKGFFHAHLDTGFALLDRGPRGVECLLHQPMIAPEGANLSLVRMHVEQGQLRVSPLPTLGTLLERCFGGVEAAIPCGSPTRETVEARIFQEREWHHQAVNVLALAPGKLVAFSRNRNTRALLEAQGYRAVRAETFLAWSEREQQAWWEEAAWRKSVILIRDNELSRAHGGPRSLVLPLRRDPLPS